MSLVAMQVWVWLQTFPKRGWGSGNDIGCYLEEFKTILEVIYFILAVKA